VERVDGRSHDNGKEASIRATGRLKVADRGDYLFGVWLKSYKKKYLD
jgi:hypothetical protein